MQAALKLVMLSGGKNIGKTTVLGELYRRLRGTGLLVCGVREIKSEDSPGIFWVENLITQEQFLWAKRTQLADGSSSHCDTYVCFDKMVPDIISSVRNSLPAPLAHTTFCFDEFGSWERSGKGLIKLFDEYVLQAQNSVVVVQNKICDFFIAEYGRYYHTWHKIIIDEHSRNGIDIILRDVLEFLHK